MAVKNYINGNWVDPENMGYLPVENPSTGEVIDQCPLSTREEVNGAVTSAFEAFNEWKNRPISQRSEYLFRLAELIRKHEEEISLLIVKEMGKSFVDAKAEVKRALQNIEVACGMPVLQQGDKMIGVAEEMDGEVFREPMGVFAMAAPFNFPIMVPFWFIPYALVTGNTYVLKPSELVPLTMQFVTHLVDEVGIPRGVFNLVNGDKTAVEALLDNPLVKGFSFVGTTRVCQIVAERCAKTGKRFQCFGSAKNHLVVMPDARMDEVIRNMITSCYGCAGQRCMAASAIICVGEKTYEVVVDRFISASRKVMITNPLNEKALKEQVVIGPVISKTSLERIKSLIDDGIREGATLALDGRDIVVEGCEKGYFIGPTVFVDVKPGMKIHQTEIFGPVVVIMKASSLDEAISMINNHEYANGASIYTQNGFYARKFKLEVHASMIGVNVGIPAPVAYLPFGGAKMSFFGDIKTQGKDIMRFFTIEKIITERYWKEE